MKTPYAKALARASAGIDWSRPCLIWLCDYVVDVTGFDPADRWRHYDWTERRARRAMAAAGRFHPGSTPVEKALRQAASTGDWIEVDEPEAPCVGVFNDSGGIGLPAIYDGAGRWLLATALGAHVTTQKPTVMWRLPSADYRIGSARARPDDGGSTR